MSEMSEEMCKVVIAPDNALVREWLAASERAEQLWQSYLTNAGTTLALTTWIIPRLDLAAYNLVSHLVTKPDTRLTVRSTYEENINDDDVIDDEFNLLVAVGLLRADRRGRYVLAIPQFDAAGFRAAVEREDRRRSDELDTYAQDY